VVEKGCKSLKNMEKIWWARGDSRSREALLAAAGEQEDIRPFFA
jgi:hypothetical protein